jgi:hypothetical protein
MKAIAPEEIEQTIATEDTLRLIVDTTRTLIHTGRPDGYLDYSNRGLFARESEGSGALRARGLLARAVAAKAFFVGAAGDRGPGRVTKKM